jgi:hypothetical protein
MNQSAPVLALCSCLGLTPVAAKARVLEAVV